MPHDDIPLMLEREVGLSDHYAAMACGFGFHAEQDDAASEKAGHPVFKDVVYFKCVSPGETKSIHCQPATDRDKKRFPGAWAAFQARETKPIEGLLIEEWPQITRAQAMTLRAMHIHTVEALAEVHDGNVGALGHLGRELVAKARAFRDQAKNTAAGAKYAKENEELKSELAESRRMIAELAARVQRVEGGEVPAAPGVPRRRGPGRPKKQPDLPVTAEA